MSLSDIDKPNPDDPQDTEDFKPIDLGSLESFEQELSQKTEDQEPDFNRFKMLFDPSELEEEDVFFEALYSFSKEITQEDVFEPLIEGTGGEQDLPESKGLEEQDTPAEEEVPQASAEELGFEQGFAKGLIQGRASGEAEGKKEGYEKGFAKGEAEGVQKGEADGFARGEAQGIEAGEAIGRQKAQAEVAGQMAEILDPFKKSLETADQLLDKLLKRYEGQIVELVYKIAQKAVLAKLELDEQVVKHTIMDALKSLVAPEQISLSVSTDDYEYVQMVKDEFFESVRTLKHVSVSSDSMIPRGGCRIESAAATISTDPESKLKALYDAIVEAGRS
ncbi:MAG: flagellar biosynthesis/type III secretory pathway protein [Desulfobacter sp.]|nr:flagellar biosynthesis/type III secretory pathway protein [Desulfobacter sp.]WDP88171.1 MAG: flagellar biosynthesis/type III secretory pathway protein [Desulfobacter sp.]